MKNKPEVSVLCLVHNNKPVTEGFVNSLFTNTTGVDFELIFLDNGSTDEVSSFLIDGANKNRWKLCLEKENIGIIKGRNLLIEQSIKSSSKYIVNIDNDQYVQNGWLMDLVTNAENGNDIIGVEGWCMYPPGIGGSVQVGKINISTRSYYPFKKCKHKEEKFTYIGCGGTLIKKDVIKKIGVFDERFSPAYFEDPDYSFRAIQAGFSLAWSPSCSINHLSHKTINCQVLFEKQNQFAISWQKFIDKWTPYFPL